MCMYTYAYIHTSTEVEREGSGENTKTVLLRLSVVKCIFISVPRLTDTWFCCVWLYCARTAPPGSHRRHLIDWDGSIPCSPTWVHCPHLEVKPVHTAISISNLSVPSSLCTSKEPFTNWPQYADDTGLYCLRVSLGVLSVTQEHFIG